MEPLLTSDEMRSADRFTVDKIGIPAIVLMEHAADAVVSRLEARFGSLLPRTKGLIFAGAGNNGGDAIAVGRLLFQYGVKEFTIFLSREKSELSRLCKEQLAIAEELGISIEASLSKDALNDCDWIVDGIFGTGLSRNIEGKEKSLIEAVREVSGKAWIVSIDLPSGLSADTGKAMPTAVSASETVALGFYKRGLVTGDAGNCVGKLSLAPIQIPRSFGESAKAFLFEEDDAKAVPPRSTASHKGMFGHVYIWAGESEREGASLIASLGSLRVGAGLVTVLGSPTVRHRLPVECMVSDFKSELLKSSKAVFVVGPGMGTQKDAWKKLQPFLESKATLVLDADALTLISEENETVQRLLKKRKGEGAITVFTPHPKEAARLLGKKVEAIEQDRFAAIEDLTEKYPVLFLLKGHGTLIKEPKSSVWVTNRGNSGLAKGGSGDLLSGIIAGALAQGIEPLTALAFSSFCHGRACELVTQQQGTERACIATEVAEALKPVFQELCV